MFVTDIQANVVCTGVLLIQGWSLTAMLLKIFVCRGVISAVLNCKRTPSIHSSWRRGVLEILQHVALLVVDAFHDIWRLAPGFRRLTIHGRSFSVMIVMDHHHSHHWKNAASGGCFQWLNFPMLELLCCGPVVLLLQVLQQSCWQAPCGEVGRVGQAARAGSLEKDRAGRNATLFLNTQHAQPLNMQPHFFLQQPRRSARWSPGSARSLGLDPTCVWKQFSQRILRRQQGDSWRRWLRCLREKLDMPKIRLAVYRATAGGAVPVVLLSSSLDVLQPSALVERRPCSFRNLMMIWFPGQVSKRCDYFLGGLLSACRYWWNCFHNWWNDSSAATVPRAARMFWQVMTASRCSFATPMLWRHRQYCSWCHYRTSGGDVLDPLESFNASPMLSGLLILTFYLVASTPAIPKKNASCVICSHRVACMSWKATLAAHHCVATPVMLSRRENRIGAMTLFHCSTIGVSINIFIFCHHRYFNIVIFHIRVSIRVRGLHLVSGNLAILGAPSCRGMFKINVLTTLAIPTWCPIAQWPRPPRTVRSRPRLRRAGANCPSGPECTSGATWGGYRVDTSVSGNLHKVKPPFDSVQLVQITPISLWFMVPITIVFMGFINHLITGGPHLAYKWLIHLQ